MTLEASDVTPAVSSAEAAPSGHRGDNHHQISVQLLDAQFQEPARQTYTQTLHLSLKDMDCRPGELTVRTIPNNLYTVQIPARADAQ